MRYECVNSDLTHSLYKLRSNFITVFILGPVTSDVTRPRPITSSVYTGTDPETRRGRLTSHRMLISSSRISFSLEVMKLLITSIDYSKLAFDAKIEGMDCITASAASLDGDVVTDLTLLLSSVEFLQVFK